MNFGDALHALKNGQKVARVGWNGKGMWLYLVPANSYPAQTDVAKEYWGGKAGNSDETPAPAVPYSAYIAMKTANDYVTPWVASQTDILSSDWELVA